MAAIRKIRESVPAGLDSVLCYAFAPIAGIYVLLYSPLRHTWMVRFHACHSILMSSVFVAGWLVLDITEELLPWFVGGIVREVRVAAALGSIPVWILAMVAAYRRYRFAPIPWLHELAVKMARRIESPDERLGGFSNIR